MRNAYTKFGVGCLLIGAAVLIGPSFGVESLIADRDVRVNVAGDESNAFLGLEDTYDGPTIEYAPGWLWQPETDVNADVATVTNNLETALDVQAEVTAVSWAGVSHSDVLRVVEDDHTINGLGPDESASIALECNQDYGAEATDATVDLSVDATGSSMSVTRQDFPITNVAFDCEGDTEPGSGEPPESVPIEETELELVAGSITAADPTGAFALQPSRVEFDVENQGSSDVTVTGVIVAETSSDATEVDHCSALGWPECSASGDEVTITATTDGHLNVEGAINIDERARYGLDSDATIASGESAAISLEQFRSGFASQTDTTGESVTVVLVVDGLASTDTTEEVGVEIDVQIPD